MRTPTRRAQVRADLYAAEPERQRRGVARVRTWQHRGRVPPAIDATAALVDAFLLDASYGERARARARTHIRHRRDGIRAHAHARRRDDTAARTAPAQVLVYGRG